MTTTRRSFFKRALGLSSVFLPVIPHTSFSNSMSGRNEALKLIQAVKSGQQSIVKKMLNRSPSLLFIHDEQDRSLIWLASAAGHKELISLLNVKPYQSDLFDFAAMGDSKEISPYFNTKPEMLNNPNRMGWMPIHVACECGQGISVETLVGIGAQIDVPLPSSQETPLLMALKHKDKDAISWMVQILLGNGGNPNHTLPDGTTALHLAASIGHEFSVKMLLRKQAVPDAKNKLGHTPSDLARKNGYSNIADTIEGVKAVPKDFYLTRFLTSSGDKLQREDTYGLPLVLINQFVTTAHFNLDKTKDMLKRIPDLLLIRATWDELPIEGPAHVGNEPCVKFLIEKGSPLSICTATMLGETDQVKKMLAANSDALRDRGPHDFPLLWYTAIGKPKPELAEIFLKAGMDINVNVRGRSALLEACSRGHVELAELFINHGADVNMRSNSVFLSGTPIEVAKKRNRKPIIELLTKHRAIE